MLTERSDSTTSLCIDWPDTTQSILDDEFLSEEEMMIDNSVGEPEGFGNSELPLHSSLYTLLESKNTDTLKEPTRVPFPVSNSKRTRNFTKPTVSNSCMKRKKPRGMPKRPLSAYNIFFRTQRTIVQAKAKKETPEGSKGLGFEGLGKLIGKQWKKLSKEDRKKYEILAEKDGVRYRQEMDAYNQKKKMLMEKEKERSSQVPLSSAIGFETASNLNRGDFVISESRMDASAFSQTRVDTGRINGVIMNSNPRDTNEKNASVPVPRTIQSLAANTGKFPLPEGTEIMLSDSTGQDRKYRVEYKCYRMSRAEASRYVDSVSGAFRPYEDSHAYAPENWGMPEGYVELPNVGMTPV
ncbi:unnamed protein product [Cylindrotheca closterium]|uniref:HMG box domain-containing protein n=1 Tax=Cylindrotheca closterium TaxID=2856 RepID=A0AAD2JPG0_9STRA|nr:unnamed protein product [Cylindrotheca closterium]